MKFQKTNSSATRNVWANEAGRQVHIMPLPKGGVKVLASKSLMKLQIDAVVAADRAGYSTCMTGNCGLLA